MLKRVAEWKIPIFTGQKAQWKRKSRSHQRILQQRKNLQPKVGTAPKWHARTCTRTHARTHTHTHTPCPFPSWRWRKLHYSLSESSEIPQTFPCREKAAGNAKVPPSNTAKSSYTKIPFPTSVAIDLHTTLHHTDKLTMNADSACMRCVRAFVWECPTVTSHPDTDIKYGVITRGNTWMSLCPSTGITVPLAHALQLWREGMNSITREILHTGKSCIKATASIQVWLLFEGGLYAKSWNCKTRKSSLAHVKWKWNLTLRLFYSAITTKSKIFVPLFLYDPVGWLLQFFIDRKIMY